MSTQRKEKQIYFESLERKLTLNQKNLLSQNLFRPGTEMSSSASEDGNPTIRKTDILVNDQEFLAEMDQLLKKTHNLQLKERAHQDLIEAMSYSQTSKGAIPLVNALINERKFMIGLVRSMTKRFLSSKVLDKETPILPAYQNDPFLSNEFKQLTAAKNNRYRSNSALDVPTSLQAVLSPRSQQSRPQTPRQLPQYNYPSTTQRSPEHNLPKTFDLTGLEQDDFSHSLQDICPLCMINNCFHKKNQSQLSPSKQREEEPEVQTTTVIDSILYSQTPNWNKETTPSFGETMLIQPIQVAHQAQTTQVLQLESQQYFNGSPKFGRSLVMKKSNKNSVLTEYNKLFKRKAEVELCHTWVEDSDDEEANIQESEGERDLDNSCHHSSGGQARVPEPKNIVKKSRAIVRNSNSSNKLQLRSQPKKQQSTEQKKPLTAVQRRLEKTVKVATVSLGTNKPSDQKTLKKSATVGILHSSKIPVGFKPEKKSALFHLTNSESKSSSRNNIGNPSYQSSNFDGTNNSVNSQGRPKSSTRYFDEEHKESILEQEHDLSQQLAKEAELEYMSQKSSHKQENLKAPFDLIISPRSDKNPEQNVLSFDPNSSAKGSSGGNFQTTTRNFSSSSQKKFKQETKVTRDSNAKNKAITVEKKPTTLIRENPKRPTVKKPALSKGIKSPGSPRSPKQGLSRTGARSPVMSGSPSSSYTKQRSVQLLLQQNKKGGGPVVNKKFESMEKDTYQVQVFRTSSKQEPSKIPSAQSRLSEVEIVEIKRNSLKSKASNAASKQSSVKNPRQKDSEPGRTRTQIIGTVVSAYTPAGEGYSQDTSQSGRNTSQGEYSHDSNQGPIEVISLGSKLPNSDLEEQEVFGHLSGKESSVKSTQNASKKSNQSAQMIEVTSVKTLSQASVNLPPPSMKSGSSKQSNKTTSSQYRETRAQIIGTVVSSEQFSNVHEAQLGDLPASSEEERNFGHLDTFVGQESEYNDLQSRGRNEFNQYFDQIGDYTGQQTKQKRKISGQVMSNLDSSEHQSSQHISSPKTSSKASFGKLEQMTQDLKVEQPSHKKKQSVRDTFSPSEDNQSLSQSEPKLSGMGSETQSDKEPKQSLPFHGNLFADVTGDRNTDAFTADLGIDLTGIQQQFSAENLQQQEEPPMTTSSEDMVDTSSQEGTRYSGKQSAREIQSNQSYNEERAAELKIRPEQITLGSSWIPPTFQDEQQPRARITLGAPQMETSESSYLSNQIVEASNGSLKASKTAGGTRKDKRRGLFRAQSVSESENEQAGITAQTGIPSDSTQSKQTSSEKQSSEDEEQEVFNYGKSKGDQSESQDFDKLAYQFQSRRTRSRRRGF